MSQHTAKEGEGRFAPLYQYTRDRYEQDRARIRRECGLEPEEWRIDLHIMQRERLGGQA
jgi:hypothetical protein